MQYLKPLALLRLSTLLLLAPAVAGCASARLTALPPPACAELIPDSYRAPVPGAPLYSATPTMGEVTAFGDQQTGQLDKANGRTADSISIFEKCERRAADVVKALTKKPWYWPF